MPVITPVAKTNLWRLHKPEPYNDIGIDFPVPAGFIFDGASVPWPLTLFIPRHHPKYIRATLLHDYLLVYRTMSRKRIDGLFHKCLKVDGVGFWRRNLLVAGVRVYGVLKERRKYFTYEAT